jgi:chaperone LolA
MRRQIWGVVAVLASSVGAAEAAAQDRGMELLQDAAARYAPVSTLCADFVQHLAVPLLEREVTSRGRLCQSRPNLFGMRFTEPAGDLVVVDGADVWYYMPSSDARQAWRAPVERGTGGQDFHREFLQNPEQKYNVTYEGAETLTGAATHRLRLTPTTRQSYRAAVLWLEEGTSLLRQIRIEEENGNRRTVTLSRIEFDVTPPAGWFVFTPPRGVTVGTPPGGL